MCLTSANFALIGNLHWSKELITMLDNGAYITEAAALKSLGGRPLQPAGFLCVMFAEFLPL